MDADVGHKRPNALFRNIASKIASIPMILTAVVVFLGCTAWTILYSFTNSKLLPKKIIETTEFLGINIPVGFNEKYFVGLANYERLWSERRWIVSIENLAIYGFFALTLSFIIGFTLAALLDRKIRFENTFRTIFLYPFALSFIVTGLVWQWILDPNFGIQNVVRSLGFENFNFDPLYNADVVLYGLLIAGMWQGTGLIMCIMLAGLRGVDEEIWKATRVDGIPVWKTYIFVVIPMLRPVFITSLVLITSGLVRLYDLVVAQTSGGPGIASEVPAKYVMDKMFGAQNLGLGFAASTMMLVSVVIILIPYFYLQSGGRDRG
jgi:glucose/mannose transport system permease protein